MADNDEAFTPEPNPNTGGGEIVGPGGTGPYTPSTNDVRVKDTYAMAVRIKSLFDDLKGTVDLLVSQVLHTNCYWGGYFWDADGAWYDTDGKKHARDGSVTATSGSYNSGGYWCINGGWYMNDGTFDTGPAPTGDAGGGVIVDPVDDPDDYPMSGYYNGLFYDEDGTCYDRAGYLHYRNGTTEYKPIYYYDGPEEKSPITGDLTYKHSFTTDDGEEQYYLVFSSNNGISGDLWGHYYDENGELVEDYFFYEPC